MVGSPPIPNSATVILAGATDREGLPYFQGATRCPLPTVRPIHLLSLSLGALDFLAISLYLDIFSENGEHFLYFSRLSIGFRMLVLLFQIFVCLTILFSIISAILVFDLWIFDCLIGKNS